MFSQFYNKLFANTDSELDLFFSLLQNAYKVYLCNMSYSLMGCELSTDQIPECDPKSVEFLNKVKELLETTREISINEHEPLTYAQLQLIEHNVKLNKQRQVLSNLYLLRKTMLDTGKKLQIDKHGDFILEGNLGSP